MKKLLFSAVSALALAGVATAADSTQFGVLRVPSDAKETIVSVPWLESTTTDTNISVSNLVLTADLANDDELRHYKNGSYECWHIETKDGVKYWVSGPVVTEGNKVDVAAAANVAPIPRGHAVFVIRQSPVAGKGFCIMGKPTTAGVNVDLGEGYSLVAPPAVTGVTDVNTGMTWTNIDASDQLFIPTTDNKLIVLTYRKTTKPETTGWGKLNSDTHKWEKTGSITAGMGAWFKNNGKTAEKSFSVD